ncbi:mycothiol system anti-sigma-R factor [Streptomyces carpaticus]|uniref:Mycothiol system anti-sigma-R factor n=1 Tax=Streptomyces harbinensis TaxID=1176198 RepID=A0A1I6UBG9_9ACTN|nr:mycothiol system anti-sigma-R factor [Streptomyces harbinensis]UWM51198.1 mycothiol system anti-sigma-R factor [Streptomyces carpaticus]SFS98765.1 mycothiol system anti-sigma-R factor [Streptomyces harbinensis]
MSGDPSRPTDCSEVLGHLYEYLDKEMPDVDSAKFQEHIEECRPCLAEYGLEESVKKLVKRCCGHDEVPADLRAKVLDRIDLIRGSGSGQAPAGGGAAPPAATAD